MSSGKRCNFKNLIGARKGGCGCGPKSTDAIQPKPIFRPPSNDRKPICRHSSSSTDGGGCSSTSFSLSPKSHGRSAESPGTIASGGKIDGSLAVAKDSDDPLGDFRRSMLEMILEKEIYSGDELQQLLHCFLELNSPRHHKVIFQAFVAVWDGGAMVAGGKRGRGFCQCWHVRKAWIGNACLDCWRCNEELQVH